MANSKRAANSAVQPEDVVMNHPNRNEHNNGTTHDDLCCCRTLITVLLLLLLIFTLGIWILFMPGEPYLPAIIIKSAPSVSVLNVSAGQVTAKWDVTFSVWNFNDHLHLSYDSITAVAYLDKHMKHISSTSAALLSPFEQHGKEVTNVSARMQPFTTAVNRWSSYDDAAAGVEASGMVALNVRLKAMVTKPNGGWWPRKCWMTADCNDLKVVFSTKSRKTLMVGSASSAICKAMVTKPNGGWWPRKCWMTADCNDLKVVFSTKSRKTLMVGSASSAICNVNGKWHDLSEAWSIPGTIMVVASAPLIVFLAFAVILICRSS